MDPKIRDLGFMAWTNDLAHLEAQKGSLMSLRDKGVDWDGRFCALRSRTEHQRAKQAEGQDCDTSFHIHLSIWRDTKQFSEY
jgi:hypothetical protein